VALDEDEIVDHRRPIPAPGGAEIDCLEAPAHVAISYPGLVYELLLVAVEVCLEHIFHVAAEMGRCHACCLLAVRG